MNLDTLELAAGTVGIGSFSDAEGDPFAAVVADGRVAAIHDVVGEPDPVTIGKFLRDWERWWPTLRKCFDGSTAAEVVRGCAIDGTDLVVLAPVDRPQILQAGANYRTHVIDLMVAQRTGADKDDTDADIAARAGAMMDERKRSGSPYVFIGLHGAIVGATDDVRLPSYGEQPDWELELAVVLGRGGTDIAVEDALDHVAGYTIANDLTLRELVYRPDIPALASDWMRAKNPPTFLPIGPLVVPAEFVDDPSDLRLTLRLNGDVMQHGEASDMIFDVAELIAYTSSRVQLRPGDLLLTGSPAGNGAHHGRFLRDGDVIESTISGLGTQRNRCIDAKAGS